MRTLCCIGISGIADRVMSLLNGYSLAKAASRDFLFVWEVNASCGACFDDIFYFGQPVVSPTDPWPDMETIELGETSFALVCAIVGLLPFETVKMISYAKHYQPEDFDRPGSLLTFSTRVKDAADKFKASVLPVKNPIGVHIRATDYAAKMPPLEDYYAAINQFDENRTIFLASDDSNIHKQVKARYGDRVIQYQTNTSNRGDYQSTLDSAVDLCLLRSCPSLVLSNYSNFSRLAMKTDVVGKTPNPRITVVMENK